MYNAAVWLDRVQKTYPEGLEITWKNFSLEQVNSKNGPEWKIWAQPDDYPSRGLLALRAGEAAKRQGREAFERFHLALLTARHKERQPIDQTEVLVELANKAGLDAERFRKDLADRSLLANIAQDHTTAVEKYGVFGTPTFLFENGATAYLKLFIPPQEHTLPVYEHLLSIMSFHTYVGEVKRPQPPWPKGIFT